ncbi:T9SS type A sorting domain-containing protein [Psychroserpens mesophilus]|uniref:T9SS type A sorting domain-containing protein n=1 Tax=Psychroserpens mesophilus TaxID=325473 RepID=UPI003D659FB3
MKKITLLFFTLLAVTFGNAQDANTCATAQVITAGTYTVAAVDGTEIPDPICAANGAGATSGEWYSFTATVDGSANVTTDLLANVGGDTRIHVYTGACGALTCVGGNDDVATSYLSDASWAVSSGTTYYIAFDDRWDAGGFDFVLSEASYSCPTSFPYVDDWTDETRYQVCYDTEDADANGLNWTYNTINDLDADGTNDIIVNVFPATVGVAKDDWLFTPALTGVSGGDYTVTLVYNSVNVNGTANETFDIVALDAPSSTATNQTVIGSYTGITQSGLFADTTGNDLITQAYTSMATYTAPADGDFYIGIHATTDAANSDVLMLLSLSIDETLSIDEFDANSFSHFYNKDNDQLTLESSNLALESIELYNLLGQNVINKSLSQNTEVIDLVSLKDGIYLAKIKIAGRTKTIKLLKQ